MDKADLTDGRADGNWRTRYGRSAWFQIGFELSYLLILLATVSVSVVYIGFCLSGTSPEPTKGVVMVVGFPLHEELIRWFLVILAGIAGGVIFDLKWLYHSVAKGLWSQDRILWRVIVPIISGVVSVFFAFIFISGLVPFVKEDSFSRTYFSLGFGFLFGYFSDNVIAALQNFAQRYIGTTRETADN